MSLVLIKVIVSVLFLFFLLLLTPMVLWFGVRWLVRKTSLKAYSGWIASFLILFLPVLFFYKLFKGRDGNEIYEAVFKAPKPDCVHIISYRDAHFPKIDDDIVLHFHACPKEVERIIKIENDTPGIVSTNDINILVNPPFKIQSMGDSVLRLSPRRGEDGSGTEIYINSDSTEVYFYDWGS